MEVDMTNAVKRFWNEHPLIVIMLIGFLLRLISVIFSKGYGMHDDHFGPIEQPFQIMHDMSYWSTRTTPHGHSIVYPLIHFALFQFFRVVEIQDPQMIMFIVRLFHACYSLLVLFFGYKIAEALSDRETAKKTGLLLALFWAFPFLSVRNLIEIVCIPPLMAGFYYILVSKENRKNALIAGLWLGLAFVFRYQTLSITGTIGLILLFQKEFKQTLYVAVGFVLVACIIQGSADIFAWGYPFASFLEYVGYNATHSLEYTTGPWYNYSLLIIGTFIPPMSLFLLYGFFRNSRKTLIIILPVMIFFVMHSFFPNKQERFIFPVMPIILTLGIVGWEEYVKRSAYWSNHRTFLKSLWTWFWIVNIILLIPFTLYYSKKSRVEAMYTLYGKQIDGIVMVGGSIGVTQPPLFYSGSYPVPIYQIDNEEQLSQVQSRLAVVSVYPNYAVVFGIEEIDQRVQHMEQSLGFKFQLLRQIEASFLDDIFYRLNPKHNKNQTTFVYSLIKK